MAIVTHDIDCACKSDEIATKLQKSMPLSIRFASPIDQPRTKWRRLILLTPT